jgi:hypothetical protein
MSGVGAYASRQILKGETDVGKISEGAGKELGGAYGRVTTGVGLPGGDIIGAAGAKATGIATGAIPGVYFPESPSGAPTIPPVSTEPTTRSAPPVAAPPDPTTRSAPPVPPAAPPAAEPTTRSAPPRRE